MLEVNNKEIKPNLLTLSDSFIFNFETYTMVINLCPVDFAAWFSILVDELEYVSTN